MELEMPDDAVQVGIWRLQNLLYPVLQLDVRIAAQLAEHRRAFNRLVRQAVEFPEQRRATDFTHAARAPSRLSKDSASRHRSSAGAARRRSPSQAVHPSRCPLPRISRG